MEEDLDDNSGVNLDDLEWDSSADGLPIQSSSTSDVYELMDYIVEEYVTKKRRKEAVHLVNLYKDGKGMFYVVNSQSQQLNDVVISDY